LADIIVEVPGQPWFKDKPIQLTFPSGWKVQRCKMAGEDQKGLTKAQIRKAIRNPIGTKPLAKLAKDRKEVVIIFDDSTRPTKTHQYAPIVLEEIKKAGIKEDCIRFIVAPGSHGTFSRQFFAKKLGEDILDRYPVYNHNPYEMCKQVGTTSYGTPVWVNSEVMACDLKIGIGSVLYHRMSGFSGGGKIISPGVAGIETIRTNHGPLGGFGPGLKPHPTTGYLCNDENVLRLDAEETARIAGLDFNIDSVLNLKRDPIETYAGDFVQTHRKASEGVTRWHKTESPKEMDIVVVNSYMRPNEPYLGLWPAQESVKQDGSVVLICNDPEGDINHWIFNNHGKYAAASLWSGKARNLTRGARLIVYSPYPLKTLEYRLGAPGTVTWCKRWDEVIEELKKYHKESPKVTVLPDGTSGIPASYIDKSQPSGR
jgi:nickel-dependent lactate racemase